MVGLAGALMLMGGPWAQGEDERPLMRDFMGMNVHVAQIFDRGVEGVPEMFRPATSLIREYHPVNFDIASPGEPTNFPHDQWKWINWDELYEPWVEQGYRINAVLMFDGFTDEAWDDPAGAARAYGRAFAEHFGPSVGNGLVASVQLGNEPGNISDGLFKTIFKNMAEGVREVDPALPIVTPNVTRGPSHQYAKSIDLFADMTELVDVLATHSYPSIEGWPTWQRSYPEDPDIEYLTSIEQIIDWRDEHAGDSEVWVTEFGYDSSTQEPDPDTEFAQWIGVSDTEQARYLIRSFLVFSEMEMERAYMFWFNDSDSASVHGSSGLMRHYEPKPSFWAMSHLKATLGDYRFSDVVWQDPDDLYVYAYEHEDDPERVIWAIWSPTGSDRQMDVLLEDLPGEVIRAERMPLEEGDAPEVGFEHDGATILLSVDESPIYLHIRLSPGAHAPAGDMNLDGVVDAGDVGPFVLALTDPDAYLDQFGVDQATMNGLGDINGDGAFDTGDVAPFVELLVAPQVSSLPEPGTAGLLGATAPWLLMRWR